VRLWDARRGDVLAVLPLTGQVWAASFSPRGQQLVTASGSRAEIWDLPAPTPAPELELIMRCRVPYEIEGDCIRPRARDLEACAALRRRP
jgi:hypothetical protein